MKKGVSITALTMYVVVLTVIIGIIVAFNVNILGDTNNFVKTTKMYEEYSKFNMFFLQALGENPTLEIISDDVILIYTSTSTSMVEYDSVNNVIRYTTTQNSIPICENVESVQFAEVGNTLRVNMELSVGEMSYSPRIVYYAVGGWAQWEKKVQHCYM